MLNNNVNNLEWCTRKYNLEQSYETMSPMRNNNKCSLYINNVKIKDFDSIVEASLYGAKNYNLSRYSLERNLQCGEAKIILKAPTQRKNISDNKKHKTYKQKCNDYRTN